MKQLNTHNSQTTHTHTSKSTFRRPIVVGIFLLVGLLLSIACNEDTEIKVKKNKSNYVSQEYIDNLELSSKLFYEKNKIADLEIFRINKHHRFASPVDGEYEKSLDATMQAKYGDEYTTIRTAIESNEALKFRVSQLNTKLEELAKRKEYINLDEDKWMTADFLDKAILAVKGSLLEEVDGVSVGIQQYTGILLDKVRDVFKQHLLNADSTRGFRAMSCKADIEEMLAGLEISIINDKNLSEDDKRHLLYTTTSLAYQIKDMSAFMNALSSNDDILAWGWFSNVFRNIGVFVAGIVIAAAVGAAVLATAGAIIPAVAVVAAAKTVTVAGIAVKGAAMIVGGFIAGHVYCAAKRYQCDHCPSFGLINSFARCENIW